MSQLLWLLISKVLLPAELTALGAAFPPFGFLINLPILGPYLRGKIEELLKTLFDKGVVTVKWKVIDKLAEEAKKGYEPMIAMLREAQGKEFLSEEEEREYEKHLLESVRNHAGIVHG